MAQHAMIQLAATVTPTPLRRRAPGRVGVSYRSRGSAALSVRAQGPGGGGGPTGDGGGGGEMGGGQRAPLGAERDVYRRAEDYEYDYPPPAGARGGPAGGPWGESQRVNTPPTQGGGGGPFGGGFGGGGNGGGSGPGRVTNFLVAGAFIMVRNAEGMGAGVAFDTAVDLEPSNVASREILDRQTPSSELCMANGASAMVFDQRVFMSLNPFNIYVAQPEVKPGCVLRRSNWSVLERKQLVDGDQEADCKRGMNTFAFVGDLDKSPEVSCVYHSEAAENQYMKDPKTAALGDGFQPRASSKAFR